MPRFEAIVTGGFTGGFAGGSARGESRYGLSPLWSIDVVANL
jgi:hypothetical protein